LTLTAEKAEIKSATSPQICCRNTLSRCKIWVY